MGDIVSPSESPTEQSSSNNGAQCGGAYGYLMFVPPPPEFTKKNISYFLAQFEAFVGMLRYEEAEKCDLLLESLPDEIEMVVAYSDEYESCLWLGLKNLLIKLYGKRCTPASETEVIRQVLKKPFSKQEPFPIICELSVILKKSELLTDLQKNWTLLSILPQDWKMEAKAKLDEELPFKIYSKKLEQRVKTLKLIEQFEAPEVKLETLKQEPIQPENTQNEMPTEF